MKFFNILFCSALIFFSGCKIPTEEQQSNQKTAEKQIFSIVNWNTQTFFDGVSDGCEYSEFRNKSNWNVDKYSSRLSKLCKIMETLNADIFVFEEIENPAIIYDISNQFAAKAWQPSKNWNYACFCKEPGSAIGCAVLSRFPVFGIKQHTIDIRTQKDNQPSSRPVLELTANINNKEVLIFVNHWKSKSGGEQETEIWRDWQEAILARRLEKIYRLEQKIPVVICGDFNRSAEDFIVDYESDFNTVFRSIGTEEKKCVLVSVKNPWLDNKFQDAENDSVLMANSAVGKEDFQEFLSYGSYFFDGKWEKIDNFFYSGKIKLLDFKLKNIPELCKADGTPYIYKMFNNEGYSDHFPIMAKFILE